jgi:outer membrane protein OmpA-like peptidoglycan-associated protein
MMRQTLACAAAVLLFQSTFAAADEKPGDAARLDAPSAATVEETLFPSENPKYITLQVKPQRLSVAVRFRSGSSELAPEARDQLDGVGKALAARAGQLRPGEIVVEGHTDARGSAELNKRLSQRRAESVVTYLANTYQVNRAVFRPVGYGKEQLVDSQRPDAAVNRRVEFARKSE